MKYLEPDITDADLTEVFSLFGEVSNAFVSSDKKEGLKSQYPNNYGMVIMESAYGTYKALNGKILIKGKPVIVRLHRFRNLKDTFYNVNGKTYSCDDLLGVQIGKDPKHDIEDLMSEEYQIMAEEWEQKFERYYELLLYDRKKLKKECKRKKDKLLKGILVEMDKEEREQENSGEGKTHYKTMKELMQKDRGKKDEVFKSTLSLEKSLGKTKKNIFDRIKPKKQESAKKQKPTQSKKKVETLPRRITQEKILQAKIEK